MQGTLHPITQFTNYLVKLFEELGFEVVETPEIENEWYNFDSLLVPANHPARDEQDTFWLTDKKVLRTQTSAGQVRTMENRQPPVRIVIPGRVYRNEKIDATHEAVFDQFEGFAIDRNITLADLKGTIEYILKKIYGGTIKVRTRPHYYPFVEPGMDFDIFFEGKWLEIMGSGMIHPDVLKNMQVNPKIFQGFAFGMGINRLTMLYYGIKDIRLSYQNDIRFIKQFK
ncbi:phenylalanine--tRNA ligase subunit alpha [Candidatus Berkelbacteria bacterium CG_4_10_14_0_8_um_filter_35_9_33_8]|uniref:phenylalanine--tRNA ligase n=1 Tax=Candidatus Berkelbacteria bacterium CG_4_10_14_0_2_um_filter_35_9_33_12 TaxID=1974499 RepID=A0A2M7W3L5_9BACT|nr:MAG: phenylalanine--tRNA ligase subunit alpha [Candidatus Berkelbacteria bacterium CG23_combo_of_CG06-09_8_20_14_all_33_15]PIS08224.1 MAG: phenylalanine--tRNA ligase subunit alpha [Candidatus Berkelbacteria bacterium CG10_big_fil_rev_8_21_14_0_10_33_10]PIZ28441.1 MAG: phenylalanine--tRNA ligase subunit alpha [Candidatus Berkelbacteria bacterium CG_4_10_14_0_8_um_filter_35_9_33_8]PJA20117.1 MAG: phenylalanine--tRNA ligase subunit alpha [Candidatus Berkelbacteria bacterium CG_4_10_14_0_2_um_fil